MVFYKNVSDLAEKIHKISRDEKLRKSIGRLGKEKYFKIFNSTLVAEFIINKTFGSRIQKNLPGINKVFSVIIPTYNNLEYLKLCIKSLELNSYYNHELIFHINEGTDGTLNYKKKKNTNTLTQKRMKEFVLLSTRQLRFLHINTFS